MRSLALLALAGLVLAGCALGPDYRRPPIEIPAETRGASDAAPSAGTTGQAASLADSAWWDIVSDETLVGLIDEALRDGQDVQLAAWRVEEARAAAGIARSEHFPAVAGSAGWSRGREPELVAPGGETLGLYDVNVGVSWEIDLWGRIRRLNEAARASYLATEEARRGVMLSLVSEVATAYFELRSLDLELEIARRTAESFRETHDLFERRLHAGTASELESRSAAASLSTTEAVIPNLERRIAAQENRLAVLLGRNPGAMPRGASLTDQLLPPEIPSGLSSDLLQRRPDLRAAEQELIAANAEVGVAIADRFPSIRLTGAFGGLATDASDLFDEGKSWSIGGGLLTPIFQGTRLKQRQLAAVARFEQARVRYERSVTEAFAEVSTALSAYGKLADVERELASAVEAHRDAVTIANTRYRTGLADYFEVLDAQRALFPAENALARTRFERLAVLVELYRALGGGWQMPDAEWTVAVR